MINKSQKINPQDSSRNEGHKSLFSKRRITRERKSVCMWRVRDLVVKRDTSVGTNALFASTESPEILGRPRNDVVVKLHHYSPFQLFPYAYVKIASWPPHLSLYNFLPQGPSLYTDSEMEKDKQWKTLVPLFICNASLFKRLPSLLRLLFLPLICAAYDVRCFFSDAPESYCISILAPPVHVFVLSEFGSCILLGPRGFGNQ